jgi:hypothetical protein
MNKQSIEDFQIFCLENYRIRKNISGKTALRKFEIKGVFNFLEKGYDVLHTQDLEYILSEISDFISHQK